MHDTSVSGSLWIRYPRTGIYILIVRADLYMLCTILAMAGHRQGSDPGEDTYRYGTRTIVSPTIAVCALTLIVAVQENFAYLIC